MVNNDRMVAKIQQLEKEFKSQKRQLNKMKDKKWKAEAEIVCMPQKVEIVYVLCDCVHFDFSNVHQPCVRAMQKVNQVGRVVGNVHWPRVVIVSQCVRACDQHEYELCVCMKLKM